MEYDADKITAEFRVSNRSLDRMGFEDKHVRDLKNYAAKTIVNLAGFETARRDHFEQWVDLCYQENFINRLIMVLRCFEPEYCAFLVRATLRLGDRELDLLPYLADRDSVEDWKDVRVPPTEELDRYGMRRNHHSNLKIRSDHLIKVAEIVQNESKTQKMFCMGTFQLA